MVSSPLPIVSSCPALIASLTGAWIVSVNSRMVRLASPSSSVEAPDLIPFLPLAVSVSEPVPQSVTWEPSLHLRTAFSAFSFAGYVSPLFCSLSESALTVPAAASIVTCEDLPQVIGAVSVLVSVRLSKISVTSVVPFLIVTEPSAQLPDRR